MRDKAKQADWLTMADVCQRFRLPYQATWRAVMSGDIPATRFGREWRFDPRDLRAIALGLGLDGGDELEGGGMVAGRRCDGPHR